MGSTVSRKSYLFTSESVSEGHPDKVCDRISDEVVDLFFREGPKAGIDPWQLRVACETLATTNQVVIAGETRGPETITRDWVAHVARMAIKDIGYEQDGFHWDKTDIKVLLHPQSADIAQGVDSGGNKEEGAGDQGIMFGYACRDTPELMPAPIYYSHKILRLISEARHSGKEAVLGPDSKSQVTVRYENGKPVAATQIVVSHQHLVESMTSAQVRELVEPYVRKALPSGWIGKDTVWHVNPTGKFYIGGPDGDCWAHGPQDHRRHLWRRGPPRRRRLLRQGPDQGRPLGRLRGALSRQERGGGRPCRSLHDPALLCHRRRQAAVDLCRPRRQPQQDRRGQAREGAERAHGPLAARHPQAPRSQQADLRAHRRPTATSAASRTRRAASPGRRPTSSTSSNRRWRSELGSDPFRGNVVRTDLPDERGLTPMPKLRGSDPHRRKLIEFDGETWHALHLLSRDSMKSLQELADEAFETC